MYISKKLVTFLNSSSQLGDSTILLTDLEKIVFVASEEDDDSHYYLGKTISPSLKQILSLYESEKAVNYMNTTMESILDLVPQDINSYRSQIILPVVEQNNHTLEGLLIFFVQNREYLPSNLHFAMTTKHFTDLFCTRRDD